MSRVAQIGHEDQRVTVYGGIGVIHRHGRRNYLHGPELDVGRVSWRDRAAAVYLAGEESSFLTSQVRNVNGRQPMP